MESKDFGLPVYLNQASIFDLLSIIDDGFSNFSTIRTIASNENQNNASINGEASSGIGIKNIFSLINIGLKGNMEKINKDSGSIETVKDKVYTPMSLFWKLKNYLHNNNLIRKIDILNDIQDLTPGQFIEFDAVLKNNPIIETMENIKQLLELAYLLSPESLESEQKLQNPGGGKKQKHLPNSKPQMLAQVEGLLQALKVNNVIDLIANKENNLKGIITCELNYFLNNNSSIVVDGVYRVVGKVLNIYKAGNEKISLLRMTALSKFKKELLDQAISGFQGLGEQGIEFPDFLTEINAPCFHVVPIAIYT
jgi:hypothetical protein